jgi:asparagine synthase (glutamine-hydrolysing)
MVRPQICRGARGVLDRDMPGIVGFITKKPREWAEPQLLKMVKTLCHESFYTSGTWIDENSGVYIGWVARENSFADGMPVCNERGNLALVFSGEDYPEPDTERRLKERGHRFEAGAGYLVHIYEEDPRFPKNLNGRFHGLIVDREDRTAKLFNDRFGLQRIYYHESNDAFYFSAEAKAILQVRPELRSIDERSLGEFIACGCVLENRTLYRGIYALPPGSAWNFRDGVLKEKTVYFDPHEWEEQEPLSAEAYYEQLRDAFTSTLPRYFNGKEKIGVSLTGGLDTRIIMAWRKPEPHSLPCYTFGSMFRENQDVRLARRVADICNQTYQLITVGQECMSRFPHYAERTLYLTDGAVDISRAADLYNNEEARKIAPVRMVGTFGSEIILGAVMFKAVQPKTDIFRPEVLARVAEAAETYKKQFAGHATSSLVFRQPAAYHFGVLMLEQSQMTMRTPYLDNAIIRAVFKAPRENREDVRLRLIEDGNPELARLRTDRGLGGPNRFVAALNRAYLEFTFKAEYAYDYGMPQWIARVDHALAWFHLERLWLGRHKLFHFRIWYRTILAKYVQEILLDPRTLARPYLKREGVERVVQGHLKGNRNYTTEIHRLLSLELLHRLFVDSQ